MKKIIVVLLCSFIANIAALAGGTVNWVSISFTAMTAQTNTTTFSTFGHYPGASTFGGSIGLAGAHPPAGADFFWELLYAPYLGVQLPTPTSMSQLVSQGWQSAGLRATNSNTPGRLVPINGNTAATVPWNAGETNSIMMVGWSANFGTSWVGVSNVLANWNTLGVAFGLTPEDEFLGFSVTGYIAPFNSDPGATVFGGFPTPTGLPINSPNTQMFQVVYAPEPSTLVLGALGGIGLLFTHRRRSAR